MSVVASMSGIAYHNFTKPGKIEQYKKSVLCLHFLYSWIAPLGMGLYYFFGDEKYKANVILLD